MAQNRKALAETIIIDALLREAFPRPMSALDYLNIETLLGYHPQRDMLIQTFGPISTFVRTGRVVGTKFLVPNPGCEPHHYFEGSRVALQRCHSEGPRTTFTMALRNVVRSDIETFRKAAPEVILCPVLGIEIPKVNCDVDHAGLWSFSRIATAYAEMKKLDYTTMRYGWYKFYDSPALLDKSDAAVFRAFHNKVANLRMVSSFANRQLQALTTDTE